jgi:hypothetical protein
MKFARRGGNLPILSRLPRQLSRPSRACRPVVGLERFEERTLLSASIASINPAGSAADLNDTDFSQYGQLAPVGSLAATFQDNLSADGKSLVFVSGPSGPSGDPNNPAGAPSNVYLLNTATGQTTLVSAALDGTPGNGSSFAAVISPNGRYVAFVSTGTNLSSVAGQSSNPSPNQAVGNLYVRDLQTQTTRLIDQTPAGHASDGASTGQFVFSPDSKTLAFIDTSDNLTTAPVDPVSTMPTPDPGSGWYNTQDPPVQTESPEYVYAFDLTSHTTSLVSVSTDGHASGSNTGNGPLPTDLVFSPDSKSLVFGSTATDLTANPPGGPGPASPYDSLGIPPSNLFVRNLASGTTTLLSVTTTGQLDSGESFGAVFSPDGHSVAFSSEVTDLTGNALDPTPLPGAAVAGVSGYQINLFVRDLTTGTTSLVTQTPGGLASNGTGGQVAFSPDGHSIAFITNATDLTSNPVDSTSPPGGAGQGSGMVLPPTENVYIRDLATGTTKLVSATPDGKVSDGAATQVLFSPDGQSLAFTSSADDLTANAFAATPPSIPIPGTPATVLSGVMPFGMNVFVSDLATGKTTLASATTSGQLSTGSASGIVFSPDSKSLFFTSSATDLTSNPPDGVTVPPVASNGFSPPFTGTNVFVHDLTAGTTSLISATPSGMLSDSSGSDIVLSPDGQTLYFDSKADDMSSSSSNFVTSLFAAKAPFTTPDQFQFSSWQSSANESDGQAVVTVLRSGPATAAGSVNYAVQDGTAHAGTDFTATSGTLNFAAGETSKTFTVPLKTGDQFAGTLTANLVLSSPQGGTLGYPSATLNLTGGGGPSNPITNPITNPIAIPITTPVTAPVSKPAPTPIAPAPQPGPKVVSVQPVMGRHGKSTLVITFNQSLNAATAVNLANYHVSALGPKAPTVHGHKTAARPLRSLGVSKVIYNAATKQVTLTLHQPLHAKQAIQVMVSGAAGGVVSTQGTALDSPDKLRPGQNYTTTLSISARQA